MSTRNKRFFKNLGVSVFLVLAIVGFTGANVQAATEVTVPELDSPPVIDGDLSDPCWQKAAKVSGFSTIITVGGMIITDSLASIQTTVRIGYNKDNLYFGFECLEPEPGKILTKGEKRDDINDDDHIEIFLQPDLSVPEYDQLGVNARGSELDHRITIEGGIYDYSWTSIWKVKTKILKDRWIAEIALPFADLNNVKPQMGQEWGIFLCRKRKVEGKECSNWPRITGTNWHCPYSWGRMKGIVIGAKEEGGRILACDPSGAIVGKNKLQLKIINELAKKIELKAKVKVTSPNKAAHTSTVNLGPTGSKAVKTFEIPYEIKTEEGRHTVEILIEDSQGKTLCQTPPTRIDIPTFITGFLDRSYYTREKEVKAYILLDKLQSSIRQGCNVRGQIIADGSKVWEGYADTPLNEQTILKVDLSKVPLGIHTFEAILETKDGKKLSSFALEMKNFKPLVKGTETKILRRPNSSSIVLINGKPTLPLGFIAGYSHNWYERFMPEMAEAGFTHVVHWKGCPSGVEELKRKLDIAQKSGIYLVGWTNVLVRTPKERSERIRYSMSQDRMRKAIVERFLPEISELIPQVVDHPALIGWRTFDEMPSGHVSNGVLVTQKVRELDPYHNVYFSTEGGADLPIAKKAGEISALDCFLKDNHMAHGFFRARRHVEQSDRNKMVPLSTPQFFHSCWRYCFRYEQQRCHSFLALLAGARILEWFNHPYQLLGPWNDLKKIAGQIKEISPVLLEPDIEQKFSIKQGGSNPIYSRLYKKDTDYYLIAANSTIDPTAACFKMEGLRDNTEAKEFYNNTKIYSKEDELTLEFGSYEVLVYKMKLDR